ncbi:MAG: amino acid adenylation domain-containing protein [Nostoc sp. DedQUE04]|uniref:non-ribosomal peptide synthetase n=1 Tax=Nostoc sp. DedQUE04 TaxID=3075390 RepID=UPI002AD24813|nr:non-ribosomal peptide synthetase [Nostoc sp. DedQUE04]MDZ8135368.1 amino acid adenylation domain-containing protein [Nostoc sp. DedQUE04]
MGVQNKNIEDFYPLSPMQQGILFHSLAAPKSGIYFEQFSWTLHGKLNVTAFHRAWQHIVERYSILRTCFVWEGLKEPVQIVHRQVALPWQEYNWQHLSPEEQQQKLELFLQSDRSSGFELKQPPLMRLTLVQLSDISYNFTWSHHHLLLDGWSVALVFKEVLACYKAFSNGQELYLESIRPYRDYIVWLQQQNLSEAETFWRQILKGFTTPTQLSVNQQARKLLTQTDGYDEREVKLSIVTTAALQSVAKQHQLTLNTLVQGAWALLLSCYSGQKDVVFGAVTSGRPHTLAKAESMVGLFINTLPIRVQVSSQEFLLPWLHNIKDKLVEARQYEYCPLVKVQEWSEVPKGVSLFESIVVFENYAVDPSLRQRDINLQIEEFHSFEKTNYPITLSVNLGEELLLNITCDDSDRFDTDTIARMLGHLQTLLEGMSTNPQQRLGELSLLTEDERHQLLVEWNQTQVEYSQDQCIHQLFEAQVERTPDAIAVVFENQQLTYRELNNQANQLAHYLQQLGVKPEVLVGICVERSIEMIIGLLAILKAGGAYVPIDPTYPQPRLALLLNDAPLTVLLTQQYLLAQIPPHTAKVICFDDDINWQAGSSAIKQNPVNQTTPANLVYVIYTSGSTGTPKGVTIQHQSLVNFVQAAIAQYQLQAQDRILQFASISFDAACEEIFPCLLHGATLVLRTDEMLVSIKAFNEKCQQHCISVLDIPTAFWHQITSELATSALKLPESLRLVIIGGEKALPDKINIWQQQVESGIRLINSYGPTETTVVATVCDLTTVEGEVPIGRAIANMQTYVLDSDLQPVPIGIWGELHIGGIGVARGYLHQPELTSEKFIPNPFSDRPGSRLYKTGDRVRYRSDGQIEFSNRIDNQVKIRGFRIELGEIEALINEHPSVMEATVISRKDVSDYEQLVAYVVANTFDVVKEQTSAVDLNTQQASQWQAVFDSLYNELDSEQQSGFYIKGWESSYTGLHLPDQEVREWMDQTVERISALQPTQILEIGCGGSGLMLLRFAPYCTQYCATDISQNALNILQQQLSNLGQNLSEVSFIQKGADDFTGISTDTFDAVFIVSVAQYFPSVDYLLKVLEGAVNVVEPGGFIFLGDVRNFSLLEAFHTSVQLHKAPASLSVENLQQLVQKQIFAEKQLVIDPAFFIALKQHLPKISHVEIHLERGHFHNELTKFRYDVIIHVGHDNLSVDISWLDWQQAKLTLASVRQLLIDTEPDILGIVNVPNARVLPDVKAVELLKKSKGLTNVGEVRQALQAIATTGVDPEELWAVSEELPYIVDISWSDNSVDGQYQVVFKKRTVASQIKPIMVAPPCSGKTASFQTWSDFTNTPLQQMSNTQVVSQLRQHLEAKLPNYMMPSAFVMLNALPLTPNGKVDRQALPAPGTTRPKLEAAYQPPQTEIEKTIVSIWQQILNVEDVGIYDNFFELGGHSLLLIQVHSKLQKVFQRDFTLVDMFEYPTISHLAKYFSQESSEETPVLLAAHHPESRTASVQRRKQVRKQYREATKQKDI